MLALQLPILPVIIPLLLAPICALVRNARIAWSLAFTGAAASFAAALLLLNGALGGEIFSYALGGWVPPVGIEYRIDILSAFMLTLVSGIGAIMLPFAWFGFPRAPLAWSLLLLCLAGMLGIVATNDIFNMYVFLEIFSLAAYALIALGDDRRALSSAFEYLILGTVGATFFLIGVGMLYMMTGSLNLSDIALRLPVVTDMRSVYAAFGFIMLGMALKSAIFPLHIWLANAYAHAPAVVSALLSATATKVSLYLMIRMIFGLFGQDFSFHAVPSGLVFIVLGTAAALVGSLAAITRDDVKSLLAFSSVAQVGYIVIGIGVATETALASSIVQFANHALAKSALFLAAGCVAFRMGGTSIRHFNGAGKQMPWTMAAFTLAGLSLIGVPFTAGFVGKWTLLLALLEQGQWAVAAVTAAGSLLAVVYIGKVLEAAYFGQPERRKCKEAPLTMLFPLWVLALANLYFGVDTEFTLGTAYKAAAQLMSGV